MARIGWITAGIILAALALGAAPAGAESKPKRVPFQRAVTVADWGRDAYQPARIKRVLKRLKRRQHVDTVTLLVVWTQSDERSVTVRPGAITVPDSRLKGAIRAAKRLKLRVVLRPYVDRDDGGWRGDLRPQSLDDWFASYGAFIRRYATIARRTRVDGFVVGSEMTTLSDENEHWRALVGAVRHRFRGWVTYQANWGGEETDVAWWDVLDIISISAYYPVAARPGASVDQMVQGWHVLVDQFGLRRQWFARVDVAHINWRRPVMFGEIGYRPVPTAPVEPWDTEAGGTDARVQAAAYEAALRVWYRVPWFRGMHWWYVATNDAALDGHPGADHRPGPAALRTMSRWYRRPR